MWEQRDKIDNTEFQSYLLTSSPRGCHQGLLRVLLIFQITHPQKLFYFLLCPLRHSQEHYEGKKRHLVRFTGIFYLDSVFNMSVRRNVSLPLGEPFIGVPGRRSCDSASLSFSPSLSRSLSLRVESLPGLISPGHVTILWLSYLRHSR